jgi:hypothetical protein
MEQTDRIANKVVVVICLMRLCDGLSRNEGTCSAGVALKECKDEEEEEKKE